MIRRDYFVKMAQEFAQVLARLLGLKQKGEYGAALLEIDRTLKKVWDIEPERACELSLEDWIAFCRKEGPGAESLVALANLFEEQGDLYTIQGQSSESLKSHALSLGLYLESLKGSVVSLDLLEKVEDLIARTEGAPLPHDLTRRLVGYFEARGRFARAEDMLFAWLDMGHADAAAEGQAFYERLRSRSDHELAMGGLPREEVEQGMKEFLEKALKSGTTPRI